MASSTVKPGLVWLVRAGSSRRDETDAVVRTLEEAGHAVRVLENPSQLEDSPAGGLLLLEMEEVSALFEAETHCSRQEELNRFASAMAHEVRSPLAVAITASDIIQKEVTSLTSAEASSTLRDAADLVSRNVQRADQLVKTFQRVSIGLWADLRESCSIVDVVKEAIETMGLVLRRSHVTVRVETSLTSTEAAWVGRPGALTQILINLVTNAERYAYPDKQPGTVLVALRRDGDELELVVRDHGIGVPGEHREHLFMPFFSTGRDRGGSGLGLAIIHRLVTRDLGGRISVEFPESGGTAFRIRLPVVCPESA